MQLRFTLVNNFVAIKYFWIQIHVFIHKRISNDHEQINNSKYRYSTAWLQEYQIDNKYLKFELMELFFLF